jgi:hypothetical protein
VDVVEGMQFDRGFFYLRTSLRIVKKMTELRESLHLVI